MITDHSLVIIHQWGWLYVMDSISTGSITGGTGDNESDIFKDLDNPAECHHSHQEEFQFLLLSVILPETSASVFTFL